MYVVGRVIGEIIKFRRGHEDGVFVMEVVPLQEETPENFLSSSLLCEDTARRQLSVSQEESPHQNLTMLAP